MVSKSKIKESIKRLEDLKQAAITGYLDDIDLESDISFYDGIMKLFAEGKINISLDSNKFKDLDDNEKENLLKLANKYVSLCFYHGNSEYWSESVQDVCLEDYETISLKILDNFNFLIEIAKSGGETVLEQMKSFENVEGSSVIEYLRNNFGDDEALKNVMIDMAKDNSLYNVFTLEQKQTLCSFPKGTLYSYEEDKVKYTDPLLLASKIIEDTTGEVIELDENPEVVFTDLATNLRKIKDISIPVSTMSMDYIVKYDKELSKMKRFIKEFEDKPSKDYWDAESSISVK